MDARARFDAIVDDLIARNPGVERATMMGIPSVKRAGKLVAGFSENGMVFKLTDAGLRERALGLGGAKLFDPSGRGRPMKEWVEVPAAHADRWAELAEEAAGTP